MFSKKLSAGNKAEKELIDFLSKIGFDKVVKNENYDDRYSYDVTAHYNNDWLSFEVKNDIMSAVTGNVAFEYWNSKKNEPSGFARSKAVFWVHKFDRELYYCLLSDLIKFTETTEPKKRIKAGGDNNSDMLIYSKDDVKNLFKLLKTVKIEDLFNEYQKSNQ